MAHHRLRGRAKENSTEARAAVRRNYNQIDLMFGGDAHNLGRSISMDNQGRPNVHGHGSVALSDGSVRGGHWWEAYVSIVAEVYVTEEEAAPEPAK